MSKEIEVIRSKPVSLVAAEVDMQVATAKQYPRSIAKCLKDAVGLATVTKEMAGACIYVLPRSGKDITGPSVRLAEIMAATWGNLRVEGKVISEGDKFITARGTAWDMENNVLFSADVQRRITDKNGRRYKDDMIIVTGNAAVSIAIRNALFRVVPMAVVDQVYKQAKDAAVGTIRTLGERRTMALQKLATFGVTEDRILARLGKEGIEDVGLRDIEKLIGLYNAINSEDMTPEDAFPVPIEAKPPAPKAEEKPKEKVTVEKAGKKKDKPKLEIVDNTTGSYEEMAARYKAIVADAKVATVPDEMLTEFRKDIGIDEDNPDTLTAVNLTMLEKKIAKFIG